MDKYKNTCWICHKIKNLDEFPNDKNRPFGKSYECKICKSLRMKKYRKSKLFQDFKERNKKSISQSLKKWREKNKKKYIEKNKEKILAYNRDYYKNKASKSSILKVRLRSRLHTAIKNKQKSGSAVKDLGCSIEELKKHLENQFKEGMTWENWGEWHIDHIKPLNKFNLEDRNELLKAVHYTNLQPLWAKDNLLKGGKFEETSTGY